MGKLEEGAVLVSGAVLPTTTNTPTRPGELIDTISQMADIPNPRVGMTVYVKDEDKTYYVKSLKEKVIDGVTVANAQVDKYEFAYGSRATENVCVSVRSYDGTPISVGITVNGEIKTVQSGQSVSWAVPYGVYYTVVPANLAGYAAQTPLSIRADEPIRNIDILYSDVFVTTIRLDQTITDPDAMITRIVDKGGIEAIRANSHRYVGEIGVNTGIMNLFKLNDANGVRLEDGTDHTLSVIGEDVFMKLPQFWYKAEEVDTDIWDISFAYGSKPDDTYLEWDGKDLIGVYEAYADSEKLYSISMRDSSANLNIDQFKSYAQARGDGYSLVKWKHHCMMAMLFYAYYGTTDSQAVVGRGVHSYSELTGATNSLGMEDTVGSGGNGDSQSINFWGLENWWGNKYEFIDNATISGSKLSVTEDNGEEREVGTVIYEKGFITKMLIGAYLDMMPTEVNGTESTGYCDASNVLSAESDAVVLRSGSLPSSYFGISSLTLGAARTDAGSRVSSRLAYRGEFIMND